MHIRHGVLWVLLFSLSIPATFASGATQFPGRTLYPDVKIISLQQIEHAYGHAIIIDARVPYEYSIIHIKGAINVPISEPGRFSKRIRAIRAASNKPIITYCNGHACMKSYEAAQTAMDDGIKDIGAFDAGILTWAHARPDKTFLLDHCPIEKSEIIPDTVLDAHMISPAKFQRMSKQSNVLIVDVRSFLQRDGVGLFSLRNEGWASLGDDKDMDRYIDQAHRSGKTLLIYDQVGKQVRWLQYYLRKKNVHDYYFMRGGANAYFNYLAKQQGGQLAPTKAD